MPINVEKRSALNSASYSNALVRQVEEKLYRLRANIAPFVNMLRLITHSRAKGAAKAEKRRYKGNIVNLENPKFEWQEKDIGTPYVTSSAAYDSGITSIVVDDADGITAGDLLFNPTTSEQIIVTAVNTTTDTLTVERGYGTESADAIASGARLVLLGNCHEEGSASPDPIAIATSLPYNYAQIFKKTVEETETGKRTRFYGHVNKMQELKRDAWELFLEERARQYWFGQRKIDTTGTHPKRITGGLDQFISTNLTDLSGSFTYSKFMDFCESVFFYGGMNKTLFVDSELLKAIQLEVFSKVQYNVDKDKNKKFGLKIMTLITPFGELDIVYDRTLGYFTTGTNGLGYCVDVDMVEEMVMRPDVWKQNVQTPDYDLEKDMIIGEAGLKVRLEKRHGKLIL